jgi:ubiquinone biosynthesis accessory factor UbiJ
MILNTLLTAQEIVLNRFLQLDPQASDQLKQLSGRAMQLELNGFNYYWLFKSDSIYVTKAYNGVIDLILRGSVFDFMRLALSKRDSAINAIPIQVSGDMEFAKQFNDLFANLHIDWEEQLSHFAGDTVAYSVMQFLKTLSQWSKQNIKNFGQNITDYAQAEIDCLVSDEELQIFFSDVDALRDEVARLQARIERLQRKLQ